MKQILLLFFGITLLLASVFYSIASSPDYMKVLTISILLNVLSIITFGSLIFFSKGTVKTLAFFLLVFGILVGVQAIYRLSL